ncbi:hypothetical protein BST61_g55 [Cercospora zeina]
MASTRPKKRATGFLDLPVELKAAALSNLSAGEVQASRRVCKDVKDVVDEPCNKGLIHKPIRAREETRIAEELRPLFSSSSTLNLRDTVLVFLAKRGIWTDPLKTLLFVNMACEQWTNIRLSLAKTPVHPQEVEALAQSLFPVAACFARAYENAYHPEMKASRITANGDDGNITPDVFARLENLELANTETIDEFFLLLDNLSSGYTLQSLAECGLPLHRDELGASFLEIVEKRLDGISDFMPCAPSPRLTVPPYLLTSVVIFDNNQADVYTGRIFPSEIPGICTAAQIAEILNSESVQEMGDVFGYSLKSRWAYELFRAALGGQVLSELQKLAILEDLAVAGVTKFEILALLGQKIPRQATATADKILHVKDVTFPQSLPEQSEQPRGLTYLGLLLLLIGDQLLRIAKVLSNPVPFDGFSCAGLGGLSATLAFSDPSSNGAHKHKVTLLERRPNLSPSGGGMNIRPGASRILHSWGLKADLERIGDETKGFLIRDVKTGQIATRNVGIDMSDETDWGVLREGMMGLLWEKVKERMSAGGDVGVRFGVDVDRVEEDAMLGIARVRLSGGEVLEGDLILAADGIRSKIRGQILEGCGKDVNPIISDVTLYGVKVKAEMVLEREETKRLGISDFATVWAGRHQFVVSRLNDKTGICSGLFGIRKDNDMDGLWDERGDIEYVRNCFEGSCDELRTMLAMAEVCDRWKLAELPDLPRWASEGGRVALLGDSAHAMEPNAAQGYAMIVEDIGVLQYLISRNTTPTQRLPEILETWERLRKPRAERIKVYAKHNSATFLSSTPFPSLRPSRSKPASTKEENLPAKSLKGVTPDMNAKFESAAFLKWALDYDAIGEAKRHVEGRLSRL